MRPKERIKPFLDNVNIGDLVFNIWKLKVDIDKLVHEYDKQEILEYWESHSDLRFSQVLVNLGLIPNYQGFWYYMEEDE